MARRLYPASPLVSPCPATPLLSPSRRSVRDSEHEEDEEERKQSRGCALQYQHATLQVFTQFHTTAAEGTGQVVTMLGPDWLVEVTDLVSDFMRVDDPRVAHLVDSFTLAGREPGTTLFKVPPRPPFHPSITVALGGGVVTVPSSPKGGVPAGGGGAGRDAGDGGGGEGQHHGPEGPGGLQPLAVPAPQPW